MTMQPPAREQLEIIWRGEQVPGITFYGLLPRGAWSEKPFPEYLWRWGVETGSSLLHNERWEVIVWDVAIAAWPPSEEWRSAIRQTLQWLVDAGASVAWVGLEGYFCDPPELFDPSCMSGGVSAALTRAGEFFCPLDPHQPLATLSDADLVRLRDASVGLSNAD